MMRPNLHCLVALSIAIGAATWPLPAFAEDSKFHQPQTEAEKALDKIFRLAEDDANLFDFVLGRPWYDPVKDTGYARLFTKALLNAWRQKEAELVQQGCEGKYREREICGFDFNVITCAQDVPDAFVFRTVKSGKQSATVMAGWPYSAPYSKYSPYYRLVKEKGDWKLDGVDCGEGYNFNMPTAP